MIECAKRRRFTFSLRLLLVLITITAIGLGWVGEERRQSRLEVEIAENLIAHGMTVHLIGAFDSMPSYPDFKPTGESAWPRRVLSGVCGKRIQLAYSSGLSPSLTDLSSLARLSRLQVLVLGNSSRSNEVYDISPLAGLKCLRLLSLDGTRVNNIAPLADLKDLDALSLVMIEADSFAPIAKLANLKKLDLTASTIMDLSPVASLSRLEELWVDITCVSDLSALVGLSNLRLLSACDTRVYDLAPLKNLKHLGEFHIMANDVSDEEVATLQVGMPWCKINK